MKAKVAERGQVTIPKVLREGFEIRPGTMLEFSTENGMLIVVKSSSTNPVDGLFGKFGTGRHTEQVVAELRSGE